MARSSNTADIMSFARPYVIAEEDGEAANSSDNELELIDYDSEDSELEITGIYARQAPASSASGSGKKERSARQPKNGPIQPPDSEIHRYELSKGCTIQPGDTIELKDTSRHDGDLNHSGDFLRIKHIIINNQTDEVRLRGLRLRRTKYFQQLFEWKLNEVAMVVHMDEDDTRCPMVAGMEDVSVDEVLRPRDCVLTNKPYPLLSFRDCGYCAFPSSLSEKEMKQQIFHGGRLVCRLLNVLFFKDKSAKAYSGIIRQLYANEADANEDTAPNQGPGASRSDCISVDNDQEEDDYGIMDPDLSGQGKKRSQPDILEGAQKKWPSPMPTKQSQYTFGDVFCGAGGSSQGAVQAGLHVKWGLDFDADALEAYQNNHLGALPFRCNAHNFPPRGNTIEDLRVDILHLSPPCCYFSPAHTHDGQNDQANLEAIYTVGAILKKLRPRVATLEQTFGLSTREQHKANFLRLLHDIGVAGYDVRHKNQNIAEFGLVQPRKRLLIIAARRGTPLPPFPKATHGPPGSNLKPWHFISDALVPIERLGNRPTPDQYHQPNLAKEPREPYSSQTFLKGCITVGGANTYHYNGLRKYTPRELALFQSFPYDYKFFGNKTQATKQIGNAFPPIMAEALYRTIAKTLEAFDEGLIEAEDDLSDLDGLLERRGANLWNAPSFPRMSFDPAPRSTGSPCRYLVRGEPRPTRTAPSIPSRFAQGKPARPQQQRNRSNDSFANMNLLDGLLDGIEESNDDVVETTEPTPPRGRRPATIITNASQEVIEVSSGSEDNDDSDTA